MNRSDTVVRRVILSHAGEVQRFHQPLWVLRVVGVGVVGSLIARLIAEAQPAWFFPWLGVAAVCWIASGIAWLVFILPRVMRPLASGAFEQAHEEAKRRLLRHHCRTLTCSIPVGRILTPPSNFRLASYDCRLERQDQSQSTGGYAQSSIINHQSTISQVVE